MSIPSESLTENETPPPGEEEPTGNAKASREAAKYRTQLRSAEARAAELESRLASYQARELDRLASTRMSNPGDLLVLSGTSLADYVTEDGEIDAERVQSAIEKVLESRPGMRVKDRPVDHTQGSGGGGLIDRPEWSTLLRGY